MHVDEMIKVWKGEPKVMEPKVHGKVMWASLTNLPENVAPHTKLALQNMLNNRAYTEYGW